MCLSLTHTLINTSPGPNPAPQLNYHPISSSRTGHYEYLPAGNLISHVALERSGKIPEENLKEKVFPLLGITSVDYEWYKNFDDVNLGFHGLKLDVRAASKLGMLYLQGGMANAKDRVVEQNWIERSFTVGDKNESVQPFGYLWWLGTGTCCREASWIPCNDSCSINWFWSSLRLLFQTPSTVHWGSWASERA